MSSTRYLMRAVLAAAIVSASSVWANENGENLIYFGSGSSKNNSSQTTSKTPFSLGYLRISNTTDFVWGVDFAKEGTKLDSTWGQTNAIKQAASYNLLIGKKLGKGETSRFDAAFLLGMREATSECPKSYLGYQCYANAEPKTTYKTNYGAVLTWTYQSFMLGVRAGSESTQMMVGYRF